MSALLELRHVGKTYTSARTGESVEALADIDLELRNGEFLAVVGPSGCGKSTLLSLVAGFAEPTSGEVLFEGARVIAPSPARGVIFQDYALFPWRTVHGNVVFGPWARGVPQATRDERARELIAMVGLAGFEHRYPHELSGGMRQRCALARMLANDPKLWLMDEPLAAVDLQTRIILQDELLRIWGQDRPAAERRTVVFITHAIDEAVFLADRIAVMTTHPGRLKAVIDVPLPRPRGDATRAHPQFQALTQHIWSLIRDEAYRATVT